MPFTWTKKRIEWYLDASRYGDFHKRLAERITPFLRAEDTVCDFGCGLGMLDLQLASFVAHITCADIDGTVLDCLQREAQSAGAQNLSTVCGDANAMTGLFDVALMVFFGNPPQLMFDCMQRARRFLVRVANVRQEGAAWQQRTYGRRRETVSDIAAALDAAGQPYHLQQASFEFGQPLRSVKDAQEFVNCNIPEIASPDLERYLDENLARTGRDDFPFYLPGQKELGIFIIETHK